MQNTYQKLMEYQKNFPQLTFQNEGYQYLKPEIRENHKEQISEIKNILDSHIVGIREFNNFKVAKDGSILVRCQCAYDGTFTGVVYLKESDFDKEIIDIH